LGEDFSAHFARATQKSKNGKEDTTLTSF